MAANDYYNTSHRPGLQPYQSSASSFTTNPSYHDHVGDTTPPAPSRSPFNDHAYPYDHPPQSSSGRLRAEDADPFEDQNAIPMSGRGKMADSTTTLAPILPHQMEDPLVTKIDPRKQKRRSREGRWFKGRVTWVVYVLTVVQVIVFIVEIIKNGECRTDNPSVPFQQPMLTARTAILTKSPIEIHPSFNPMIGPSPYVLINMGARYQPCMHNMTGIPYEAFPIKWFCPNTTSTAANSSTCSLSELCGFGGVPDPYVLNNTGSGVPDQWWRFIVPIFLHAGIIHIGFNLLLQMTLGRDVERLIGSVRFALVYFASGIFGFVLGGNFAGSAIDSCGCSGSLFGILAITLLDLLYTWKHRRGPVKDLLFIGVDILIALVLGLLPGLDNFSHIGGFLMGLVLGVCILRSPASLTHRSTDPEEPRPIRYSGITAPSPDNGPANDGIVAFFQSPLTFFQDRRGAWWGWWIVRVLALVGCLVAFILLLKNFYVWRRTCGWCKYMSCLDVTVGGSNWCDVGNLNLTFAGNQTAHSSRSIFPS